jgi:hypothetical protein
MKVGLITLSILLGLSGCMAIPMLNDLAGKAVPQMRLERKLRCLDKCEQSQEFESCVEQECNR